MSLSHESGLGERVIGLSIDVHRHLGPGLLESAYEECLCFELKQAGISYQRQVALRSSTKTSDSIAVIGWIS
jgi:GxxExxY protein